MFMENFSQAASIGSGLVSDSMPPKRFLLKFVFLLPCKMFTDLVNGNIGTELQKTSGA